jgi:hypothetical protein
MKLLRDEAGCLVPEQFTQFLGLGNALQYVQSVRY